jgi:hypothetical protein
VQTQAALLVALGRRQREVAKQLGVTHETVCRWNHLPAFESTVVEIQQQLLDSTRARHISLLGQAMDELQELLRHPDPVIKLRAIQLIMQPLRMPGASLKECREQPNDERDFVDFIQTFKEAGGQRIAERDREEVSLDADNDARFK